MSDRPTDPADPLIPGTGELQERTLSEILEELALLSHAQQGEASEMRSAVSELSRALARLFEMIRTDRREQHTRIAELERELVAAREQLAALGIEPVVPPAPNDFDQLRAAAERLRVRTQQLVREAADAPVIESELPDVGTPAPEAQATSEDAVKDDLEAVDAPLAPAVLRVLPEQPVPESVDSVVISAAEDFDVESELPVARVQALRLPAPEPEGPPQGEAPESVHASDDVGVPAVAAVSPEAAPADESAPADRERAPRARPEPIAVAPRPARKRALSMRRRRIDARKLAEVEPLAALGSMVGAVQQIWTAGCTVDLVVAFIDGGAVRVSGGDRSALRVEEVEPGTPARCTVTATRRQLVPLFGRLELTDEDSAPLIHGSRRDADLLVGWFDRAQRLAVEAL